MMPITIRQKFYAAAAVAGLVLIVAAFVSIRSRIETGRLNRAAREQIAAAAASEQKAAAAEAAAARQSARAEYLEQQLREIRDIATKQDEELKKLNSNTDTARGRVERAHRVRSIESTSAELCEKLKSLGHGCE